MAHPERDSIPSNALSGPDEMLLDASHNLQKPAQGWLCACVKCNLFTIILLDWQLGAVMLDEIRTFVVLAEAGSLQRAAERLFLTPSAVTRQIQRLEATLKMPLLDRRVKPARITREGRTALDSGRQMLRIMDDLKATGSKDAEPSGIFR
ncbi:MAG TPA: LysR family transcriptional regulator, partial [Gemmatimonadaceae bacterium]|nr:LysR family transcriptional regulator [Gemmatimonadaceae bacterium]